MKSFVIDFGIVVGCGAANVIDVSERVEVGKRNLLSHLTKIFSVSGRLVLVGIKIRIVNVQVVDEMNRADDEVEVRRREKIFIRRTSKFPQADFRAEQNFFPAQIFVFAHVSRGVERESFAVEFKSVVEVLRKDDAQIQIVRACQSIRREHFGVGGKFRVHVRIKNHKNTSVQGLLIN